MRKFDIAAIEFINDEQVAITLIRETVMPNGPLIAMTQTFVADKHLITTSMIEPFNDLVEDLMRQYAEGLIELKAAVDEDRAEPDEDADSIEVR